MLQINQFVRKGVSSPPLLDKGLMIMSNYLSDYSEPTTTESVPTESTVCGEWLRNEWVEWPCTTESNGGGETTLCTIRNGCLDPTTEPTGRPDDLTTQQSIRS